MESAFSVHLRLKFDMNRFLVIVFVLISGLLSAQVDQKVISPVSKATVYLSGATLEHMASFTVSPGYNQLVFEKVSPYVQDNSMQVKGNGQMVILDIQHRIKQAETKPVTKPDALISLEKQLESVQDSIKDHSYLENEVTSRIEVYNQQKNMITNALLNNQRNDTFPVFKESVEYISTKLLSISAQLNKASQDMDRLGKIRERMTKRINEISEKINKLYESERQKGGVTEPVHEVVITVSASQIATVKLELSYFIQYAAWSPSYEIDAKGDNETIDCRLIGMVQQNSGLDWKETSITFSTGNPNKGQTLPELTPWNLNVLYTLQEESRKKESYNNKPSTRAATSLSDAEAGAAMAYDQDKITSQKMSEFVTTEQSFGRMEYKAGIPVTLKSGNPQQRVLLKEVNLPANYVYAATPKSDRAAFLMAEITGWEKYNFIPASAKLYYKGSFAGETYVRPSASDDTLRVSMGRDDGFILEWDKLKDKSREKLIGTNKVKTFVYEITVRNPKSSTIEITIKDQIPVSQQQEIKVTPGELSGGVLEEFTGILTWKYKLKPGETKKIQFFYEVSWPKDWNINL